MILPLTAILPTRNAMGSIEAHVRALREWLPRVAQVVVVDSSEDGTLEYLRSEISLPNVEFHSRPKGLYEGWNFGVRQAREDFVYFSTVGDSITLEGLRHLWEVAQRHAADITISPPEMFDAQGAPILPNWPIHDLCAELGDRDEQILNPHDSFLLSVSYVPSTVLGSSASNLYRRAFLTQHPFLESWGHCADSPWMIENSLRAKVTVTTKVVARFVVHPREPGVGAQVVGMSHYEDMYDRARAALRDCDLPELERRVLSGWLEGLVRRNRLFFERIEANVGYLARRDIRIKELGERVVTARERAAIFESDLKLANQKVIELRRQLGGYERAHRSLIRITGLYLSVKWAQARKALALLNKSGPSST